MTSDSRNLNISRLSRSARFDAVLNRSVGRPNIREQHIVKDVFEDHVNVSVTSNLDDEPGDIELVAAKTSCMEMEFNVVAQLDDRDCLSPRSGFYLAAWLAYSPPRHIVPYDDDVSLAI